MPVSVIVGGQFGSEGKGKVALHVARSRGASIVVRVGGPNSGHTGVDATGKEWMLRQLPASCLHQDSYVVLPAGSLIDPDLLRIEMEYLGFDGNRLLIDGQATVVTVGHSSLELKEGLPSRIGSTGSGTGAALRERISRVGGHQLASDHEFLRQFVRDFTPNFMREYLRRGERIVIEGTQGFGLSLWHGGHYPYATSRDTTAAGFVAETGLAPHDVDEVVLVLRSFPIRVGGVSGPLPYEIDWPTLANEAGLPPDHHELTSATRRVRRVGRFDGEVVRRAITVNSPTSIVLNHLDYIQGKLKSENIEPRGMSFLVDVERQIGQKIDLVGLSASVLVPVRQ